MYGGAGRHTVGVYSYCTTGHRKLHSLAGHSYYSHREAGPQDRLKVTGPAIKVTYVDQLTNSSSIETGVDI